MMMTSAVKMEATSSFRMLVVVSNTTGRQISENHAKVGLQFFKPSFPSSSSFLPVLGLLILSQLLQNIFLKVF
jgi:hypothetical protein